MKNRIKQTWKGMLLFATLLFLLVPDISTKASQESKKTKEVEMTQVAIEEADMTMQLPVTCYILKQNIAENDPYLEKVEADREKVHDYYKEAGIILNAIAPDNSYEIAVTMNENSEVGYVYNMQSLTEEQIKEFADVIQDTYSSYGYTVDAYKLYETEQIAYIVFGFSQTYDEKQVACKQYYTIRDSKIYNITLRCYTGEIDKDMEKMLNQVIDSIAFGDSDKELVYENVENGVTFSLAEGWTKVLQKNENQYVQAQYTHVTELGESIQFFCMDLWGNMDTLHQLTRTREGMSVKEGITKEDIKQYKPYIASFFDNFDSVSVQKLGEYWYLTSETPIEVVSDSIEGVYLQRSVVTIRDGILYAYQYGYYEDGNLHEKDFEEMINQVSYGTPNLLANDGQYYKNIAGMLYKMTALVIVIVVMFAGVLYLYYRETKEEKLSK